jgi:hypothetical protein
VFVYRVGVAGLLGLRVLVGKTVDVSGKVPVSLGIGVLYVSHRIVTSDRNWAYTSGDHWSNLENALRRFKGIVRPRSSCEDPLDGTGKDPPRGVVDLVWTDWSGFQAVM